MLNHIVVMGRLTRDPELRTTQTGTPVVSFTVAVDRDFADRDTGTRQTDFIDVVAWRTTAEFVARNYAKGDMVIIMGRLQLRDWIDKEGQKRRNAEIVAETVYFGETRQAKEARVNSYGNYSNRDNSNRYDNYGQSGGGYQQQGGSYQSGGYQSSYGANQGGYSGNNSSSLYSGGNTSYPNNSYSSYQPPQQDYSNNYQESAPVESSYQVPAENDAPAVVNTPTPKVPDSFQELDDPDLPF
jgi:single-strand DNA-binding protein